MRVQAFAAAGSQEEAGGRRQLFHDVSYLVALSMNRRYVGRAVAALRQYSVPVCVASWLVEARNVAERPPAPAVTKDELPATCESCGKSPLGSCRAETRHFGSYAKSHLCLSAAFTITSNDRHYC